VIAVGAYQGRAKLTQVSPVRAVAPAPVSPATGDRPRTPPAPTLAASAVALAPAAMGALLEAQERLSVDTTPLARSHTARKIDQLIDRLDGDPPPPAADGAPLTVRRLQVARENLG
jgi:hypothetical protein